MRELGRRPTQSVQRVPTALRVRLYPLNAVSESEITVLPAQSQIQNALPAAIVPPRRR
jgi:hypothetical protein